MQIESLTVTEKVISEYYSPVFVVKYNTGTFTRIVCTREVVQCKKTNRWLFAEDHSRCSNMLSNLLNQELEKQQEVRRSSFPPMRND